MGSAFHKCTSKSAKKGKNANEIEKSKTVNVVQNSVVAQKEANLNQNPIPNVSEIKKNENLPELVEDEMLMNEEKPSANKEGVQASNFYFTNIISYINLSIKRSSN